MADVTFEEDTSFMPMRRAPVLHEDGIVSWLIRNKFASNATQANTILVGLVIVLIVATIAVIIFTQPKKPVPTQAEKLEFIRMQNNNRSNPPGH